MKKKTKIIIIILPIIILFTIVYICFLSQDVLYKRLQIDLSEYKVIELEKRKNIESVIGTENERLTLKFDISEKDLEVFIKQMEGSGYYYHDQKNDTAFPNVKIDGWDVDYDKVEMVYYYDFSRYTFSSKNRCHVQVFITETVDGIHKVYIDYIG